MGAKLPLIRFIIFIQQIQIIDKNKVQVRKKVTEKNEENQNQKIYN